MALSYQRHVHKMELTASTRHFTEYKAILYLRLPDGALNPVGERQTDTEPNTSLMPSGATLNPTGELTTERTTPGSLSK